MIRPTKSVVTVGFLSILLSACGGSSGSSAPANTDIADATTVTPSTDDSSSPETPLADDQSTAEAAAVEIENSRLADVDCNFTLPCTWTNDPGDLTVELTRVISDSENVQVRNAVYFTVRSANSIVLEFSGDHGQYYTSVIGMDGSVSYGSAFDYFEEDISEAIQVALNPSELMAGVPKNYYARMATEGNALSRIQLILLERDIFFHYPSFRNIPANVSSIEEPAPPEFGVIGNAGVAVNCQSTVPCTWRSGDGKRMVTVRSAGATSQGTSVTRSIMDLLYLSSEDFWLRQTNRSSTVEFLTNAGNNLTGDCDFDEFGGSGSGDLFNIMLYAGIQQLSRCNFSEIKPEDTMIALFSFTLASGDFTELVEFENLPGFPER